MINNAENTKSMNQRMATEKQTRVMVIDDVFVEAARIIRGVRSFEDYYEEKKEDSKKKKEEYFVNYVYDTRNPPFFDLSNAYHDAGGRTDVELLVLGNPVCSLSSDIFHPLWHGYKESLAESFLSEEGTSNDRRHKS